MPVPDHQCPSHGVVAIDSVIVRTPSPEPQIIRTSGSGTLDIDQLAAVIAWLLEL